MLLMELLGKRGIKNAHGTVLALSKSHHQSHRPYHAVSCQRSTAVSESLRAAGQDDLAGAISNWSFIDEHKETKSIPHRFSSTLKKYQLVEFWESIDTNNPPTTPSQTSNVREFLCQELNRLRSEAASLQAPESPTPTLHHEEYNPEDTNHKTSALLSIYICQSLNLPFLPRHVTTRIYGWKPIYLLVKILGIGILPFIGQGVLAKFKRLSLGKPEDYGVKHGVSKLAKLTYAVQGLEEEYGGLRGYIGDYEREVVQPFLEGRGVDWRDGSGN